MPNLLSYSFNSLKIKRRNNNLKLPFPVKCSAVSPSICDSISLIKFLDKHKMKYIY